MKCYCTEDQGFNSSGIDPVLQNYSDYFTFSYVTDTQLDFLGGRHQGKAYTSLPQDAHNSEAIEKTKLTGVSPSPMLTSAVDLDFYNKTSALDAYTQLYTAGGSQSMGLWYKFIENAETNLLLTFQVKDYAFNSTRAENVTLAWNFRTLFTWFDDDVTGSDETKSKVSLPMYAFYSNAGIGQITFNEVALHLNENMTPAILDQFKSAF
jgi:hypothetical protein